MCIIIQVRQAAEDEMVEEGLEVGYPSGEAPVVRRWDDSDEREREQLRDAPVATATDPVALRSFGDVAQ